jgi:nicotinamidase-related amidase
MSASSTDRGLLTPENCGIVFIDYQPHLFFGAANIDRQMLLNNMLLLAKTARIFAVPVILTALESTPLRGSITPQLQTLFPNHAPIERSSMNAWDSEDFIAAIKRTGRKNFLMAALWSEACLTFPALQMLEEGYGIYVVEDASGGTSQTAHAAAIRRVEQAGAVSLTAFQVLLEFQRDWARRDHYEEVMAIVSEHCGVHGQGLESAAALIPNTPPKQVKNDPGPKEVNRDRKAKVQ